MSTSSAGYAGNWLPAGEDPRAAIAADGPPDGELATYRSYLTGYRMTGELKCQDLTPEQLATRSVPPSTLSLLGLVRHMGAVEHFWFQKVLQGGWEQPRLFRTPEDHDLDFNGAVGTQECVDEAFAVLHEQVRLADAWLDGLDASDLGKRMAFPGHGAGEEQTTVRDVLVHMIEEWARHAGHADLLRECIDGRTGQ